MFVLLDNLGLYVRLASCANRCDAHLKADQQMQSSGLVMISLNTKHFLSVACTCRAVLGLYPGWRLRW